MQISASRHSRLGSLGGFAIRLALLALSGCPPQWYVHDSTSTAVNTTASTLDEPENRRRLREIFGSLDVRSTARELAEGVLDASGAAISDPEVRRRIDERVDGFVQAVSRETARSLREDLGPAAREQLRMAITEGIDAATSDDARSRVSAVTSAVSKAFVDELAVRLPAVMGPETQEALRSTIQDALGPAMAAAIDTMAPALGRAARVSSREALAGINDELSGDLGRTIDARGDHFLDRLDRIINDSKSSADEWLYAVGTLAILLLGVAVVTYRAWRRSSTGRGAREATVDLLAAAIHDAAAGGSRDAQDRVDQLKASHPGAAYLETFYKEHPHMRADPPKDAGAPGARRT